MDITYWKNYYDKNLAVSIPSPFAELVAEKYVDKKTRVLELGCGNGRDAFFLAKHAAEVIAIDQSIESMEHENIKFMQDDFTNLDVSKLGNFDIVYSRFTMHAIKHAEMLSCFESVAKMLCQKGLFLIEARSEKNELYKQGIPHETEENTYLLDNHYRRFLNKEKTESELKESGFTIIDSIEDINFAPFKDENHHFLRIIATR